jgi:oligosaccharide amylase
MPRALVLGNGKVLVNLDENLSLRDLYYPHVGQENHIGGHRCRIGVWVDGSFSWIDDSWQQELKYKEDSLVTHCTLTKPDLGITLIFNDAVHFKKTVFIRKITVKNLYDRIRDFRIFFSHDFRIYEYDVGDTAIYNTTLDAMVHYKKRRYFAISTEPRFDQFSAGVKGFHGMEGTWKDAEDGLLGMNPIAQGSVDSTIRVSIFLKPEKERTIYQWIAVGNRYNEVKNLNQQVRRSLQNLINDTHQHWYNWVNKKVVEFHELPECVEDLCRCELRDAMFAAADHILSRDIISLYRRSLLIIKTQIDSGGAIIAANDTDTLDYNRDHYSYMWPRDGAMVAYALDEAGYHADTRKFFKFCSRIITSEGYFLHKYNPDGSLASSWHPYIDEDGNVQLPIQEDETGLVLHSLWHHYERTQDIDFVESLYDTLIKPAADFMMHYRDPDTGLPQPSYDLWEERRGVFPFTVSAVYAGLKAASRFARMFTTTGIAEEYDYAAESIKKAMLKHLYSSQLNRFLRNIAPYDDTVEASFYAVFAFNLLPPEDERVVNTMRAVEQKLNVAGGIARYENDYYRWDPQTRVTGNPWFICTLWLAEWYVAIAKSTEDLERALNMLEWVVEHATSAGLLAEQTHPVTGEPLSVSPLTWSHATFVHVVNRYLERLRELVC